MTNLSAPAVEEILPPDLPKVSVFLNQNLNSRLSASKWKSAIQPPWTASAPNHGFMLIRDRAVAGVALAFYSSRIVDGAEHQICNLGALCVVPELRMHTFRLIRAALKQRRTTFTDFSPSGNVIELNRRLGFEQLETATDLTINTPVPKAHATTLLSRPDEIATEIQSAQRPIFETHRQASAAHHLLAMRGTEQCYVIFRRDRRKGLPLFASILYVSNQALYPSIEGLVGSHLLRHRVPARLTERRVAGSPSRYGWTVRQRRPKMFKSEDLVDHQIDYLFSELVCVPW